MQEDLAKQRCSLNPGLTHADGIGLVDLWLQKSCDQREQDFSKNCRPILMICRRKLRREKRALQARECLLSYFPTWIQALSAKRLEYGGPVCYPRCLSQQSRWCHDCRLSNLRFSQDGTARSRLVLDLSAGISY